ncbi:hypothetical protein EC835_10846 [Providencia alcalifaciens]|uniref:Uncharacterized protein n=1 Tax=Providencia alcalifaciens TaxID=126385 RepID=A0A4V2V3A6_9GAMM|nr:hypothetical protein [Providencia alcalifaciens]TCT30897.1 hypothetical protein EC835_10846 [Providencia alcalifaciens]
MKIDSNLLNTLSASRTHGNTPSSLSDLHTKMSTLWKSRNNMKDIQNYQAKNIPHISEDKNAKIQSFITEFKHQDSDKTRFALVFKTMVNLNRNDKESFITQIVQILKSPSESEPEPALYKDFTKAIQRYMSISLMNTPFTEQLNKNMTSFNLDGDEDEDSSII